MDSDKGIGGLMFFAGIIGILVYGWLIFFSQFTTLVMQLTGFVAVAGALSMLIWIGYSLLTTPTPEEVGDIDIDELDENLDLEELEEEAAKEKEGEEKKGEED